MGRGGRCSAAHQPGARSKTSHSSRLRLAQVVSCLLLFLEEEDALWMMCALIEDLLPPSYFSSTLLGIQTDQRVLRQLIVQYLPALDRLLQEHDIGDNKAVPPHKGGVWWRGCGKLTVRISLSTLQNCL